MPRKPPSSPEINPLGGLGALSLPAICDLRHGKFGGDVAFGKRIFVTVWRIGTGRDHFFFWYPTAQLCKL